MQAGLLRHRVTLQQRSTGEDALGQQTLVWTDVAALSAHIEQLAGRELMSANAEHAENTARVTIRYRPAVFEKMRLLFGAVVYDITSVSDLDGRRRLLELMCKTGLSNG